MAETTTQPGGGEASALVLNPLPCPLALCLSQWENSGTETQADRGTRGEDRKGHGGGRSGERGGGEQRAAGPARHCAEKPLSSFMATG